MPAVTQTFQVHNMNDPAVNGIDEGDRAIYLDMLLSEYYGKMVRQGNSFKITGIQAALHPDTDSAGIDVGMSAQVFLNYVPATKHSKFAWNQIYKGWRNQKKLATAVGGQIRYDDLEFGWSPEEGGGETAGYRARTSTIFGSGMADAAEEKLVLTGTSVQTAGANIGSYSMADYYNSAYETPDPSRDPFTNTDIKEAKWGATPFPETQTLSCAATSSAQWFRSTLTGSDIHQGAITMADIETLPTPCNALCGVLEAEAYIMPDDTIGQFEDDFFLTITIWVSKWSPLVFRRKSRKGYRKSSRRGKSYGRKRTYKSYRRRR